MTSPTPAIGQSWPSWYGKWHIVKRVEFFRGDEFPISMCGTVLFPVAGHPARRAELFGSEVKSECLRCKRAT